MAVVIAKKPKSVTFSPDEIRAFRKYLKLKRYKVAAAVELQLNLATIDRLLKLKTCSPETKERILPFIKCNTDGNN